MGTMAEEVRLELTNPVRGSGFQDRCNSRYATPPSAERVPCLIYFSFELRTSTLHIYYAFVF